MNRNISLAILVGLGLGLGACKSGRGIKKPSPEVLKALNTPPIKPASLPRSVTAPVMPNTATPATGLKGYRFPSSLAPLIAKLKPAVINIFSTKVTGIKQDPWGIYGSKYHYSRGLGTGFIINSEGYALTNNHVVERAAAIQVRLSDERIFKAKVIGRDKRADLALIRIIGARNMPTAKLGDSDALRVGDWVIAIGNPFGLAHTVTTGIVSAKERVIGTSPYEDFIQTDASINPGNSGGPLFDMQGRVVGINTAIHKSGYGIGFAVPINLAKAILPQLKTRGRVIRGWLGVSIRTYTREVARALGQRHFKGVLIAQVIQGMPAEQAGIRGGDVIVSFHGRRIKRSVELSRAIAISPPGTTADIVYMRNGKKIQTKVTLGTHMDDKPRRRPIYRQRAWPRWPHWP